MNTQERSEAMVYSVVANREAQYSIWPVGKELPPGWSAVDKEGFLDECLAYIDETWTDMLPLSLLKPGRAAGPQRPG